jgi:hypothetical protein
VPTSVVIGVVAGLVGRAGALLLRAAELAADAVTVTVTVAEGFPLLLQAPSCMSTTAAAAP